VFRLRAREIRFDSPRMTSHPFPSGSRVGRVAQFPVPGRQWLTVTETGETRLSCAAVRL